MTFVAVIKPADQHSAIFRIDTETGAFKVLTRIDDGYYNQIYMGTTGDRARVDTVAPIDKYNILTVVWDGPKESQQLFVVDGKGKRHDSPEGVAPKEAIQVKRLTFGDSHDEKHNLATGEVLELLVYDRALHESERIEVENYYRRKYFKN